MCYGPIRTNHLKPLQPLDNGPYTYMAEFKRLVLIGGTIFYFDFPAPDDLVSRNMIAFRSHVNFVDAIAPWSYVIAMMDIMFDRHL
jgi:hypothetical protein